MTAYQQSFPQVMTASGGPVTYVPTPTFAAPAACSLDDLWRLAEKLLAKVGEVFARCGVPLPDRQYIALASPAQDCEQVTVSFQQAYIGPPGDEAALPQRCESPRSAVFQVVITRCVPVVDDRGRAPTVAALTNAAQVLMQDAWLLLQSSNEMDDYLGIIATVEATDAEGGLQSVVMTLTLGVP
jgi:hypothetical protein